MLKNIIALILIALPFSVLSASDLSEDARSAAKNSSAECHLSYLQCYALNPQEKDVCVKNLANQYIDKKYNNNEQYTTAFQHEAEKLGFLKFLHDHNLTCTSISKGPKFTEQTKAYKIDCDCNHSYFMKFDYNKKEWKIVLSS